MKKTKVLVTILCAILLVTATVLGTLAYLSSQEQVVNTFTVGKVKITLDETAVNTDGTAKPNAGRVKQNNYHLIPGQTYIKDPILTVKADSEDSYIRMLVTITHASQFDTIFANKGLALTDIFGGYNATDWINTSTTRDTLSNTVTYEFRYKEIVAKSATDTELSALFQSITIPGEFSSEDMNAIAQDLKITVIGQAIQTAGFADEDTAWANFQ